MSSSRREAWADLFGGLGEAVLEVLRAEVAVLFEDWGRTARLFGIAVLFFAGAASFGVYLPALILFFLVTGLQAVWGLAAWQAALAVIGIWLLTMAVLVATGYFGFLRRLQNPLAAARQHLADHLDWWRQRVLPSEPHFTPETEPDRDERD